MELSDHKEIKLVEGNLIVREYGMKLNPTKCKNALNKLKEYFATTPVLMKPVVGEPLLLYMSVYDIALGTILVKEDIGEHRPVYYLSKMLQGVELRYIVVKRFVLALVITAQRLRPYFQLHHIVVLTNQSLKEVSIIYHTGEWKAEMLQFLTEGITNLEGAEKLKLEKEQQGKGQKEFKIVAIEYFSKWIEAEAIARITKEEVMKFLWKNMVQQHGIGSLKEKLDRSGPIPDGTHAIVQIDDTIPVETVDLKLDFCFSSSARASKFLALAEAIQSLEDRRAFSRSKRRIRWHFSTKCPLLTPALQKGFDKLSEHHDSCPPDFGRRPRPPPDHTSSTSIAERENVGYSYLMKSHDVRR
ncbi:UNVERIFIED_CONTAM: hypothetical protein Scaly_0455300 [Sesamum calycinum]|uniref:Reverse transcriptase/retrotransposon-derived protein RNase H-like domain-containing protein n=1 Tax=Sesamum calycinum TaxID=2727403 RepID=A0AAW2SFY7_9LAMI